MSCAGFGVNRLICTCGLRAICGKMKLLHFVVTWAAGVSFIAFVAEAAAIAPASDKWNKDAQDTLAKALNIQPNVGVAKNVIFFLGDGMGVSTVTAARIYKGQVAGNSGEETQLNFEKFPYVALSKTYNVDRQTADSAGTATAFMCGVKANYATVGVDETVLRMNCSKMDTGKVNSILDWSLEAGKSVGIVTTSRVTHATPSASYAHCPERNWESDADMLQADSVCKAKVKDIALQLIDDNPLIQVIMGGGRSAFFPNTSIDPETGQINTGKGRRDQRNLTQEWRDSKPAGKKATYVWNKQQFDNVTAENTDFLLGLFNPSHMEYELKRDPSNEPSIAEMVTKAISILSKNSNGFFLLVEGARIDHAHHDNYAKRALSDTVAMDDAVAAAQAITGHDTLLVVTADHSHVFNIAGYPGRGNNLLGLVSPVDEGYGPFDRMPYTTLVYANGPGPVRANLTGVNTTLDDFQQPVQVRMSSESHGGEDVAIYATGPMAHLFHSVHEQNYITHVMAYASCVGANKDHCNNKKVPVTCSGSEGLGHPRRDVVLGVSVIMAICAVVLNFVMVC